jgi:VWFA-related protein
MFHPAARLVRRLAHAGVLVGGALALLHGSLAAQQEPVPQFRSSVDVTPIDVTVVDGRGAPVRDLKAADFTVTIDGQPRRVADAEWVPLVTESRPELPPLPPGYSANDSTSGGRLILIVVDQPNIRFGGTLGIRNAVTAFIDRLKPADRVAAIGIGRGSPSIGFTADREKVKQVITKMTGHRAAQGGLSEYYVAISEAMAIRRGEPFAFETVVTRECAGLIPGTQPFAICVGSVEAEAQRIAMEGTNDGDLTMDSLRAILTAMRTINAPKTMVLVSEGFIMDERRIEVADIGALASSARTSIYVLKLEEPIFEIAIRRAPGPMTRVDDHRERGEGIATLAASARGTLFNVVGTADGLFARIESELSGYYLLGVESVPDDSDGRPHPIKVEVGRPGVTIRTRREVIRTPDDDRPLPPSQAVIAALSSPLVISALPLRVTTFSLQGPDASKVQLLIHASIGSGYTAGQAVALAYQIMDRDGKIVDGMGANARLRPAVEGVPSPLQFTGGASLAPGDYTLKLAFAEGPRVGTVEHAFSAQLVDAAPFHLTELMSGGPVGTRPLLQPTIGHTIAYGTLHGYLEGYGADAGSLTVKFEVAPTANRPALISADVPVQTAGDERAIFSHMMMVRQLPPGPYVLRALVFSPSGPLKTLIRDFEIAAPAVLMTSAGAGAPAGSSVSLYLPVGDEQFARAFRRQDATGGVLGPLRSRVAEAARPAFDRGLAQLAEGQYEPAERSFKEALKIDADSTAVLVFLAANFAASGHDQEAASAWQTALIDTADVPEIYEWLADTLMRIRDLRQARAILEEAVKKWPADARFAKPLALLYATFGEGREAMRALARHLEVHPEDTDAMALGVEWIYQLHSTGAVVQSRDEDVKLARIYADVYKKTNGPQSPLVGQWMEYLESR